MIMHYLHVPPAEDVEVFFYAGAAGGVDRTALKPEREGRMIGNSSVNQFVVGALSTTQ